VREKRKREGNNSVVQLQLRKKRVIGKTGRGKKKKKKSNVPDALLAAGKKKRPCFACNTGIKGKGGEREERKFKKKDR